MQPTGLHDKWRSRPRRWRRNPLHSLKTIKSFRTAYLARLREFSGSIFKPERFAAQIAEIAPVLRPVVTEERGIISGFEAVVAGRAGLMPFAEGRAKSVIAQLARQ